MDAKKITPGQRVVDELWPNMDRFPTGWGTKTAAGLGKCIDKITAAPDLLAAAKNAALAMLSVSCGNSPASALDARRAELNAAIAKAEGGGA
jgi:hypothetical protein